MQTDIVDSISDFSANEWNTLVGNNYPFLRHEFLEAAEKSGCVAPETGWIACHIGLRGKNGQLIAAMPLYEKTHSWGEFVFDWTWANAYQNAGYDYYPKLVSAVPFTPAASKRLLSENHAYWKYLIEAARELASARKYSSIHILFPEEAELDALRAAGLKLRKDCQFHWHNRGYKSFDDFLATFNSTKRKKVRRDRRHVSEQGITFKRLTGGEMDQTLWREVYELISMTFRRRGSLPYFNLDFFMEISSRLPETLMVVIAKKKLDIIGAAIFFDTGETLYGRYWGADNHYNALHFETCYYQGIDYCIENHRKIFEPGTQGEHKISRGFTPVTTWSAHWLAHPEFFTAVSQFVNIEQHHIDRYIDAVKTHTPYRKIRDP